MEEIIKEVLNYAVVALFGVIGWVYRTLQNKADREELEKLQSELNKMRENMFKTLATKEDVNKLELKIDKLIDRELAKK